MFGGYVILQCVDVFCRADSYFDGDSWRWALYGVSALVATVTVFCMLALI